MPQRAIFVGVQASGRTAFYRERCLMAHVRISRDLLPTPARVEGFSALCLDAGMDAVGTPG